MLIAQVSVVRSPVTAGVPSVEQSAPRLPSNASPGVGENPQTLQFAVHPGTLQHDEYSAPGMARSGALPMAAPASAEAAQVIPTHDEQVLITAIVKGPPPPPPDIEALLAPGTTQIIVFPK